MKTIISIIQVLKLMKGQNLGKKIPKSIPRQFMNDFMHFSKKVPLVSFERKMNLKKLIDARNLCLSQPSWYVLFIKAFAIVSARNPHLRRSYLMFPRPHIFEYHSTTALLAIERFVNNEAMVLFTKIEHPERLSLKAITQIIKKAQKKPLDKIRLFNAILILNRLPSLLRRALWWLGLNLNKLRAYFLGTFAVTGVPTLGASSLYVLSPLGINLTFGIFAADGTINIRLHWDHRLFDGVLAAQSLRELEEVLQIDILDELSVLAKLGNSESVQY